MMHGGAARVLGASPPSPRPDGDTLAPGGVVGARETHRVKVLVTGATGFLGGYVVRELLRRGHTVRALVRAGRPVPAALVARGVDLATGDLLDPASLVRACAGVDGLVHAAIHSGYCSRQDALQHRTNEGGARALFDAARRADLRRVVHVSTVATIGPTRDGRLLDETAPWKGRHFGMQYVHDKLATESLAMRAAADGLPVTVVNPGSLIGPRLDGKPPAWHLRRVVLSDTRWAPPGGISVVDAADVAAGVAAALERGRAGERYLLTGHNLTNRAFYERLAAHVGRPRRFREIPRTVKHAAVAATTALDRVFGWSRPPYTPEYFRLWGWYGFFDASKAATELGFAVRPLERTLDRYDWSDDRCASAGTALDPDRVRVHVPARDGTAADRLAS